MTHHNAKNAALEAGAEAYRRRHPRTASQSPATDAGSVAPGIAAYNRRHPRTNRED